MMLYQARKSFPLEFLDHYIFSSYPDGKRAVGFKLFPDQLDNQHFMCVWDWIEQNRDVAIIFLSRQNRLAAYTSLMIAKKTGDFEIVDESQRQRTTITIDPEKCQSEFRKRDEYEAVVRERIANHRSMELTYENLNENPHSRIEGIQEFLGLDHVQPAITLIKQEVRPLPEVITNYHDLKQHFANTKWAHCFENE